MSLIPIAHSQWGQRDFTIAAVTYRNAIGKIDRFTVSPRSENGSETELFFDGALYVSQMVAKRVTRIVARFSRYRANSNCSRSECPLLIASA
jgi:hypothetical protein